MRASIFAGGAALRVTSEVAEAMRGSVFAAPTPEVPQMSHEPSPADAGEGGPVSAQLGAISVGRHEADTGADAVEANDAAVAADADADADAVEANDAAVNVVAGRWRQKSLAREAGEGAGEGNFGPGWALTLLLVAACSGTVPSRYEIRDLRVISIVADHPEVSPGDTVQLTAYFEDPLNASVDATMQQCPNTGTQTRDITCVGTSTAITLASEPAVTPAVGVANVFSAQFSYTEPLDALDSLPTLAQRYGFYDQLLFLGADGATTIDSDKRVVVTPATVTPKNQNPSLSGFDVLESAGISPDLFAFERGQSYTLTPDYDPSSLENYAIVDYEGNTENFVEEATFVWSCAQSCTFDRDTSYGPQTVTLTIPSDWDFGNDLLVNVVMRDGRGGEVPFVRRFRVLPSAALGK